MYPCKFLESRKIQGYITFQKGLQWRTHTGGMIHTDSNIRHFNIHVFRHTLFKYTLVVFLHYFNITGIWVYSIKIYKYPNLKIFRYSAVCIQTHIYSGITYIPTQNIQTYSMCNRVNWRSDGRNFVDGRAKLGIQVRLG